MAHKLLSTQVKGTDPSIHVKNQLYVPIITTLERRPREESSGLTGWTV